MLENLLISFFHLIFSNLNKYLFDNCDSIRYHARIRTENGRWVKWFAFHRREVTECAESVSEKAWDRSLLSHSFDQKRAILYSINRSKAEMPCNKTYKDFITYVIPDLLCGNEPIISIGVSFMNEDVHRIKAITLLHFFFEKQISYAVKRLFDDSKLLASEQRKFFDHIRGKNHGE